MSHIPESVLERYVLRADLLGEEERAGIDRHLSGCPLCAGMADFLRGFHEELRRAGEEVHPAVDRLVARLLPRTAVLRLRPFEPDVDDTDQPYTTVLAALTEAAPGQRFVTRATLAAAGADTLVRFVEDVRESVVTVYVQSADPARRRFALVLLPEAGVEILTDERGRVRFPSPPGISRWSERAPDALLVCPVAEIAVRPADLPAATVDAPLRIAAVDLWTADAAVQLRATRLPHSVTRAFLLLESGVPHALVLSDGAGSFPRPDGDAPFTLLLYP